MKNLLDQCDHAIRPRRMRLRISPGRQLPAPAHHLATHLRSALPRFQPGRVPTGSEQKFPDFSRYGPLDPPQLRAETPRQSPDQNQPSTLSSISNTKGVGIKLNFNQAYATDCVSASILKMLAKKKQIPLQEFIVRNDSPCGSTIGRFVSALSGIKTIDVGSP